MSDWLWCGECGERIQTLGHRDGCAEDPKRTSRTDRNGARVLRRARRRPDAFAPWEVAIIATCAALAGLLLGAALAAASS